MKNSAKKTVDPVNNPKWLRKAAADLRRQGRQDDAQCLEARAERLEKGGAR